jgi:radical SAM superfamily enzyme YgiQ (UPF0313 family)
VYQIPLKTMRRRAAQELPCTDAFEDVRLARRAGGLTYNPAMHSVVLTTVNARYVHASFGLRYLRANMAELREETALVEFVLGVRAADMVEQLLEHRPRVIGIGVYIWNVDECTRLVALVKAVAPEVIVVIGGPEVSFEVESQRICSLADYVVTGWGDIAFPALCRQILSGMPPAGKVIAAGEPALSGIELPYREYTQEDIDKRFIYVEASRGCPFKCEFCLSSLDKTAWAFELDRFMAELEALHARGARHFRFVDRTFNLKVEVGVRILEFFLERLDERTFLHFEVIPDHLPERLQTLIARFPAGALQFEVGIQTWNPEVQARISRRQNNDRAEQNLKWLRTQSKALVHVDLIAGLPGEDVESFAAGFDRLYALRPHEIQVGILKRLRGTPIARHTEAHGMRYNPDAPYNVLQTDCIPFHDMQRLSRFARVWELVGNSGRFPRGLALLLAGPPFSRFMAFSDWLFARTGKTHEIALERLFEHLHAFMTGHLTLDKDLVTAALIEDYVASGARGRLSFMAEDAARMSRSRTASQRPRLRQVRHLQN